MPAEVRDLARSVAPLVREVLESGGRRGVMDSDTAQRLAAEAAALGQGAMDADTLRAVTDTLERIGGETLPALMAALGQPRGDEPPPEAQALILALRDALGLDEGATAEDVLARLCGGHSPGGRRGQ